MICARTECKSYSEEQPTNCDVLGMHDNMRLLCKDFTSVQTVDTMEYFCDNPECINHQKRDCEEIKFTGHIEKVIKRFETVDRSGNIVTICTACRNAIKMILS